MKEETPTRRVIRAFIYTHVAIALLFLIFRVIKIFI